MNARQVLFATHIVALLALTLVLSNVGYSQTIPFSPPEKKSHPKIESVLTELQEEHEKGPEATENFAKGRLLKVKDKERIAVYIVSDIGKTAEDIDKNKLESHGVEVIKSVGNTMKATLPIKMIRKVADDVEGISFIRLPDIPALQSITTEGLSLTGASIYHSAGYTGAGVGIAIIDVGFKGVCTAAQAGEIPGSTIFVDCSGSSCVNITCPWDVFETEPHGTAVAEIIHDMAPSAQLYILKIREPMDAVDAYKFLPPGSVGIVNYSVGWVNQNFGSGECFYYSPFYYYNPVCLVNDAYGEGILWVNSAGNQAKKHYAATFTDSNSNGFHDTLVSMQASYGAGIHVALTWDAWPATNQDYDLYLLDSLGYIVAKSENWQTGSQQPIEEIRIAAPYLGVNTYYVAIKRIWTTGNHRLNVLSFWNELTPHVLSGSLLCPADAATAFTVGAIDLSESTWSPSGQIASYSSQGPTNDGRTKPEIVGPAHVSNFTKPGFDGTSAAAPHVAGAAALILSKNPTYTVQQLWNALTSSAIDMGLPGQDNVFGFGRLNMPPVAVPITVATSVPGLQIIVDGTSYSSPRTFNWTPGSSHTISISSPQSYVTEIQRVLSSWSDGGSQSHAVTVPATDTVLTAALLTQYRLTTSVSPPGAGNVYPSCAAGCWYGDGTLVSLTASANQSYRFGGWTGSVNSLSNPVQFTMTAPMAITANFNPGTTVTTSPVGRAFIVDGSTYGSLQTFYWPESSIHTIEAPSPQTVAGTRFVFSSWSDGGARTHSVAAPSTSPVTYTASYMTQYELQISLSPPGSCTITPSVPLGDSYINSGSVISLLATPAAGYVFTSWTGDCVSTLPSVTFSMTAPRTCTATLSYCPIQPVQVLEGPSHNSIQAAYEADTTLDGGTIQILAVNLAEFVDLGENGKDIGVTLQGGFDCNYTGNSSATLLTGSLTVSKGAVTIERIIIR